MRRFVDFWGDQTYPVIEYYRRYRYINGEKSNILDSSYTILVNYEQVIVTVEDAGTVVTQEQVQEAASNGTPIQMTFKDLELTVRGTRNPWELQVTGRASQAVLAKDSK